MVLERRPNLRVIQLTTKRKEIGIVEQHPNPLGNGVYAENEIVTLVFPDGKTTYQASGRTKRFLEALINAEKAYLNAKKTDPNVKRKKFTLSRLQLCSDVYQGLPFSETNQNLDYFVDSVRDELRDKIGPWKIVTIPNKQDTRRLKNNRLKTYELKNEDEERAAELQRRRTLVLPNGQKIFIIGGMPRKVLKMIMKGNPEGKPVNNDELLELFSKRKVFKKEDYSTRFDRLTTTIRNLRKPLAKLGYTIKTTPATEGKTEELRGLYFYTLEEQKMPTLPAAKPADSKPIEPKILRET